MATQRTGDDVTPNIARVEGETIAQEQRFIPPIPDAFSGRGGQVQVSVLNRQEISVPIHLPELFAISSTTARAGFWWSVTTFFAGAAISFFLAGLGINNPSPWQIAVTRYTPIICALFAVISLVAAIFETARRNTTLYQIHHECGLVLPTWAVRFRRWWSGQDVQVKDSPFLVSPMPRLSPKNPSALSRDEAESGQTST
jgi:hypothetical protein